VVDQGVRELALQPGDLPAVPLQPRLARAAGSQLLAPHDEIADLTLEHVARSATPSPAEPITKITYRGHA